MRVMQVIYSFKIGGSESVAKDIALNMQNNVSHALAALQYDGPLRQVLEKKNIITFIINKKPSEKLGPMVRLWKAMIRFKPDVVHTHHLYELFYSWPGALLAGAQIIHTEHEYYSLMSSRAGFWLRHLSRFCRAVTGVNEETAEFLKNLGIPTKKVHTIVNGIDLKRFRQITPIRGEFFLSTEDLVAGVVARLSLVKNHDMLIRAFRIVVDNLPQAKLLIIGDGSQRQYLQSLVAQLKLDENVKFLGTRSDVPALLACMDVVVLSSREEGLPLSILEAMSAGKPVVATDVGGISTVVRPEETGLLVPSDDVQAMAGALLKTFKDPNKMAFMGKNGRRLIEQGYDLNKSIEKYFSLYQGCLKDQHDQ